MGTNHVDNSARLCHAASTVAMKRTLGYGATTCSYTDWIGTDLIVFFGSNTPNNQPVTMKYLYHARQQGAKVAVVNPYFEPGLAALLGAFGRRSPRCSGRSSPTSGSRWTPAATWPS